MTLDVYLWAAALAAITLILNLPFGFLRAKAKRYSLRWFLCIHLPIPLIYYLRHLFMLTVYVIPLLAVAAVLGQIWGGKIMGSKSA